MKATYRIFIFLLSFLLIASSGCIDFVEVLCQDPEGVKENVLCGAAKVEKFVSGGDDGGGNNKESGGSEVSDGRSEDPCPDVSGVAKYDCLANAAMVLWDPSICELIGEESYKAGCYYGLAKDSGDPTFCGRISSFKDRKSCRELFFADKSIEFVMDCDRFGKGFDECFEYLIQKGDPEVCRGIQPRDSQNYCLDGVLPNCFKKESREECLIKTGIAIGDCDEIADQGLQDACWARLLAGENFIIE